MDLLQSKVEAPDANTDLMGMVEPCTIFILDEHLQRFPLESMDMMSNVAITRIPSLPFVFASLLECETIHSIAASSVVDPIKVKYGIDPESNLSVSASTIGTALNLMASTNGWEGEGVAGKMPSFEFMSEALTEEMVCICTVIMVLEKRLSRDLKLRH